MTTVKYREKKIVTSFHIKVYKVKKIKLYKLTIKYII